MLEDQDYLLDDCVSSRFQINIRQPAVISKVQDTSQLYSRKNDECKSMKDDSLDQTETKYNQMHNYEALSHSINIFNNNMHPDVNQFLKDNFGEYGLELLPVELFNNALIKEFQTLFSASQIEGIKIKLLNFLKNKMDGSLIDIDKLNSLTKAHGLIGLVSEFMANLQIQPITNKAAKQLRHVKLTIKNFTQNLFYSLQKQLQYKLSEQVIKITQKYNIALTMLYKVSKKQQNKQCIKHKQQIQLLNNRILQVELALKRSQYELSLMKISNNKLNDQNIGLLEKLNKMNEKNHIIESISISNSKIVTPLSKQNNSFEKTKPQHVLNVSLSQCKKTKLSLIPEILIRGRSQSSSNLQNLCFVSKHSRQQSEHKRLKTQDNNESLPTTPRNNKSPKKNTNTIGTKNRPGQQNKKWKM